MSGLGPLPSQLGERTEEANRRAAERCLADPALLQEVVAGLRHKEPAIQADCAEVLTMVAGRRPEWVAPLAPDLAALVQTDASVIVRDYAVEALGAYAAKSREAAEAAFPILREALAAQGGKQAGRALDGLANVAGRWPEAAPELQAIANRFSAADRPVVRKAAARLQKALHGQ